MSPTDERDEFTHALARTLKHAKDESPYTIRSLSEALGVAPSTVRNYLDGSREVPVPILRRMAGLLGTTAGQLLDDAEAALRS